MQIKSIRGAVLFEAEVGSVKLCVEAAVKARASLRGANLEVADLRSADLRSANLEVADLRSANLEVADLRSASLRSANLEGANLAGANLECANLAGANLEGANLAGANLAGANLEGANLAGADLAGANLEVANLAGANLEGANLIDGGQNWQGNRFWCWRYGGGHVVYRGGCREWESYEAAVAHYAAGYTGSSKGHEAECLARLKLMRDEAERRGWYGEKRDV